MRTHTQNVYMKDVPKPGIWVPALMSMWELKDLKIGDNLIVQNSRKNKNNNLIAD